MNENRYSAAAAALPGGQLLVTGGLNQPIINVNSTELLTETGWENTVPFLSFTIAHHCMVTVNSTTVMAIGGSQGGSYSGKTHYYSTGTNSWVEGPQLKYSRDFLSCGRIRRDQESQEMSIIVAAGDDQAAYLSSTEILDEGSNEWRTGPELPFGIFYSQMVEDQRGGVVLIGGRSPSTTHLDTLFQLPHGGKNAVWTEMDQKLEMGRHAHTAFLVSDNIVDCS